MEKLIIEYVVGYMLKVMKSGVNITKFQDEFAAIRHGNYDDFIDLIKAEKPLIMAFQNGEMSNQDNISQKTHCDFAGLVLAGPSLKKFFNACCEEYGKEYLSKNDEISNKIYGEVVLFEIGLRMHANNNRLLEEREKLVDVIIKLSNFKNISQNDANKLQKGRQFINDIKHHNDKDYKRKFSIWSDGISAFEEAYEVIKKYELVIF